MSKPMAKSKTRRKSRSMREKVILYPLVAVEALGGADVRLFYSDGTVIERSLPGVKDARRARVVDMGMGIDPDGRGDMSAAMLRRPARGSKVVAKLEW